MELCRFLVFCFVFAFCKFVYIYFHFILKAERARKKQTQAVRSSKCWFTTQMTTKNQDWARSKLKPRPGSRSPPRVAGTQLLEQSPDASQSAHHQEATLGRTAMTQNQALQYGNEASSLWGQMWHTRVVAFSHIVQSSQYADISTTDTNTLTHTDTQTQWDSKWERCKTSFKILCPLIHMRKQGLGRGRTKTPPTPAGLRESFLNSLLSLFFQIPYNHGQLNRSRTFKGMNNGPHVSKGVHV